MGDHPEDIAGNDGNRAELACSFSPAFHGVLKSDTFVDKSGLILALLNETIEGIVLCTAPRRFGKTVNLSMLQTFLELEVDETGKEKTTVLEDKDNYKLFKSARSELIVMRNKKFVETHFGQYPIVNINFVCDFDVKGLSDAVMVCRIAIRQAFTEHRYLYESKESPLKDDEKKNCERWCDTFKCEEIPNNHVQQGVACLAVYLNKFHKKKVFLLVDEYDSIVSSALYKVKAADREAELEELECISKFPINIIGHVLKRYGGKILQGAYMTGILDIAGTGISCLLGSVLRRKFGTKNLYQDFCGFNETEVSRLFNRWGVNEELQTKAMVKYNGYNNGALKLYSPFSIVQFLANLSLGEDALHNYWQQSSYIQHLYSILRQDETRDMINTLLQGVEIKIKINIRQSLRLHELKQLHNLLISNLKCNVDIVYRFLVSLGYLTYSETDGKLKIPNSEIIDELTVQLQNYFYRRYGINKRYAEACADSFSKLARLCGEDDDFNFKEELVNFQNNITSLFQQSEIVDPLNEATVQAVITATCPQNGFLFGNEIETQNRRTRSDVILYNDTFGCVVEIKCDPQTVEDALKQIFGSHYYNVFTNTKYFNACQKTPSLSFVMGMHVDSEKKASVQCLRRKDIANILDDLKVEAKPSLETRIEKAVKSESSNINTFCEKAIRV